MILFGSKLFDTQTTVSPTLSDLEAFWILKQKRTLADAKLFSGLRVKSFLLKAVMPVNIFV